VNISSNPRNRHELKRGRPYRFNEENYRRVGNSVEKFFVDQKSFKRITMRYERLASTLLDIPAT
jgi:TfoX/Sxy family transcriptional regulator of competence genes